MAAITVAARSCGCQQLGLPVLRAGRRGLRQLSTAIPTVELGHGRLLEGPGSAAEPLIVLHGLLGNKMNWKSLFSEGGALSTINRPSYALDLRNHGGSPHDTDVSYAAMAADVVAFLDKTVGPAAPAAVLGHSMGGKVAMHLALHYPSRVSKLVVVDISPAPSASAGGGEFRSLLTAMQEMPLATIKSRKEADRGLAAMGVDDPFVRMFLLTNLKSMPKGSGSGNKFGWKCNLSALLAGLDTVMGWPDRSGLGAGGGGGQPYDGPTLFVGGGNSPYIRIPEHEPAIKAAFPFAEVTHIPNAGHFVHVEQPLALGAAVTDFLRKG